MANAHRTGKLTTPPAGSPTPSSNLIWLAALLVVFGATVYLALGRRGEAPAAVSPLPSQPSGLAQASPDPPVAAAPAPAEPPPQTASAQTPTRRSNLQVTRMSPTKLTFTYRDTLIEVEFSRPVNQDTVPSAFHTTPPMEGVFAWPAPNRLVFRPNQLWDHAATYEVAFASGITDLTGLDELEPTSWKFSTVGGYSYTRDILPLVKTYCVSCHRQDGPAARIRLDTHAGAMQFIRPGNADNSRFLTALTDGTHAGKVPPPVASKSYMIRDWITTFEAVD